MTPTAYAGPLRQLFLALLATASLLTTACLKDDTATRPPAPVAPAVDEAIITKYIAANAITGAQRQPSGLYFVPITTNPTGTPAVAKKTVDVLYTGRFLDGTVFDASSLHSNTPISFVLGTGQVIPGWDEGIALMRKGEKSTLLIPSALGYGAAGRTSIPPNTVLRFEVELVDVK